MRTIRETWGADSGTNVVRRETFYRSEMTLNTWLRLHVIPPLDGIYAQSLKLRSAGEPQEFQGAPRRCWTPEDGAVDGDARLFQGSIGSSGVHLLFLVDSDNARTTTPINEIVFEHRQVFLPGEAAGPVGQQYGRGTEKPLVAVVGER